ncbi:HPr family phosphocarrier protein [Paeniglutamicibacter antarcticus]|uniref:Phosphocarrier protein HPr n=1 Tax=Arthrobacter terrae TaxID=2935737 RepID=A0A931CPV6_9MICC|nr:HPr family phosphocarrier protein [Arthrobacter terrae]MBG0740210.1 HPr family phosphocarrier protein [Arthrobacter terrae]
MYNRLATVAAVVGLHARPAAQFVGAVNRTGLPVTIARPGHSAVDARSLLAVMTADFGHGCQVVLSVTAPDVDPMVIQQELENLAGLLATDLSNDAE